MEIDKLLKSSEGRRVEFKRDLSSLKPVMKTLVAFANTAGGTIVIGRDDNGVINGLKDVLLAEEKLASAVADSIQPPLMPEIEMVSKDGHDLLVVRISHWRGPFFIKSMGEVDGVFVRLGSTNRVAGPELLAELKRSIMKVSFDQLPCPEVGESELDMQGLKEAFAKVGKKVNRSMLETLGILVPYNGGLVCSNGGVILFGKEMVRRDFFPNTEVRCARFEGIDKVNFIDQLDVTGSLLEAIEEVPKFIRRNTRLAATIQKVRRENVSEYSPIVIREVLANAFVHADYSIKGMKHRVGIFSDRLEIESPGMLPFGFALDDFFSGVSHIRNKVLARVFRELHLIEEWGTGYKRIVQTCKDKQYPLPRWEELGAAIRVVLQPHDPAKKKIKVATLELTQRQEAILNLLANGDRLTTKEIFNKLKFSISERTLRGDLVGMKEKRFIKMYGKGPSTKWGV